MIPSENLEYSDQTDIYKFQRVFMITGFRCNHVCCRFRRKTFRKSVALVHGSDKAVRRTLRPLPLSKSLAETRTESNTAKLPFTPFKPGFVCSLPSKIDRTKNKISLKILLKRSESGTCPFRILRILVHELTFSKWVSFMKSENQNAKILSRV